jgi:glycosyltransferase involved in cell wall biosynthesis
MSPETDPADATRRSGTLAAEPVPFVPFVIVTGDLVRTGGMDRANLALASYLARTGHPVHAVAHRVADELTALPNFHFHRVSKPGNSYFLSGPLLDRAGRRVGKKIARAGGRVIVNGGNCRFADINWVHYVHAAYTPSVVQSLPRRLKAAWSHRAFMAAEARCLRIARLIITNSDRTGRDLVEHVGIPPERIHTVYLGTDADRFCPPSAEESALLRERLDWPADRPVVIFIGALGDRRKGFDTAFDAWRRLCQQSDWDADLAVIGQGAELAAWQQRAADAGMASRIRFMGFRNDVPDLLRAADALIAPTRYEPYGLGVQEALCCGLPALVSANAGVAERYPENMRALLLPNCQDSGDLRTRLLAWRSDMAGWRSVTRGLSDQLRTRTWDKVAEDICRLSTQISP